MVTQTKGQEKTRISLEEETVLFRILPKSEFLEMYAGFVANIARRYHAVCLDFEDLVNYGIIGLSRAYDAFDTRRNCRFTTYAHNKVRKEISEAVIKDGDQIKKPKEFLKKLKEIEKAETYLEGEGYSCSSSSIAELLGTTPRKVETIRNLSAGVDSLMRSPVNGEEYLCILDNVPDCSSGIDEKFFEKERNREVYNALASALSEKEMRVIALKFGLESLCIGFGYKTRPHSNGEVAEIFGYKTPQVITNFVGEIFRKLRANNNGNLSCYLNE